MDEETAEKTKFAALLVTQFGVFARHQLLAARFTRHHLAAQMKACRWQRLLPGIYATTTGTPTREMRLQAALLHAGEGSFLSHETAAQELGLGIVDDGRIHVTAVRARARGVPPKLVVHRNTGPGGVPDDEVVVLRSGMRCASAARTVIDLASQLAERERRHLVVRAAQPPAGKVRRGVPEPADLASLLARRCGHPWSRVLGDLVVGAPRARSGGELRLATAVAAAGFPGEPNVVVQLVDGESREGDLVFDQERVVVQVDSKAFHEGDEDFAYDIGVRDDLWIRAGWLVVRVTPAEIEEHLDRVVRRVVAAVLQRRALLTG